MELLCPPEEADTLVLGHAAAAAAAEATPAALAMSAAPAPAAAAAAAVPLTSDFVSDLLGGAVPPAMTSTPTAPSSSSPSPPTLTRQRSRVTPKGEEELLELLREHKAEEQRLQAELERLQKVRRRLGRDSTVFVLALLLTSLLPPFRTWQVQREEAKARLEALLVDSDFSWMRQVMPPRSHLPQPPVTSHDLP
jgi:hypothetical protein